MIYLFIECNEMQVKEGSRALRKLVKCLCVRDYSSLHSESQWQKQDVSSLLVENHVCFLIRLGIINFVFG